MFNYTNTNNNSINPNNRNPDCRMRAIRTLVTKIMSAKKSIVNINVGVCNVMVHVRRKEKRIIFFMTKGGNVWIEEG